MMRSISTSVCSHGAYVLIVVKNILCPSMLVCPMINVEQLFIQLSVSKTNLKPLGGVYLLPLALMEMYSAHTNSINELCQSSNYDLAI